MSAGKLRWIILFMSTAVVGLIAFQWYWVDTVIDSNEDRFHKDVLSVLEEVVQKIERQEILYLVNQKSLASPLGGGNRPTSFQGAQLYYEFTGSIDSAEINFFFSMDATGQVNFSDQPELRQPHVVPPQDPGFGKEQLESQLQKVNNKSEMVMTVLEELMVPRRLSSRINAAIIDSLLQTELEEKGINLDYYFGVIKPNEGRFVSISDPAKNVELSQTPYKAYLFPNDIINDPSLLSIHFPGESDYLLGQMWLTISSSAGLIIIILICFGYALTTIIRQKNISTMKNDFINNMTHELKTPIATIGLAIEALQDKAMVENTDIRGRYLNMIGEENQRLGAQVEKVLQMAMIDKRQLKLEEEIVSVHGIIEKAIKKISLQIENNHGTLNTSLNADSDIINADASHLLNVLLNLFDNSIKYSEDAPKIMIRTHNVSDHFVVSVKDHGIGMSKEEVKHIFQRFYRVTTGNLHNVKGFGLGLAYVKNVVEIMGGDISVESESKKGTNFILKFPLADV